VYNDGAPEITSPPLHGTSSDKLRLGNPTEVARWIAERYSAPRDASENYTIGAVRTGTTSDIELEQEPPRDVWRFAVRVAMGSSGGSILMRGTWLLVLVAAVGVAGLAVSCSGQDEGDGSGAPATVATAAEATGRDDADGSMSFNMPADTVQHHWEALTAIKAGDVEDARHHVEHILEVVAADETHAAVMRDVLAALAANKLDEAAHGIEGMLVGRVEPGLTPELLHLQMALAAMRMDDEAAVRHHIDHFIGLGGDDADAQQVIAFLDNGHHEEAAQRLELMIAARVGEASHNDSAMGPEPKPEAGRITVVMTEFAIEPTVIRAHVGERVLLVATNRGTVLHDIAAEGFHGNVESVGVVEAHDSTAGADHADTPAFHASATAGGTGELVFEADEPGEYALFCTVPGHRELGMTATLIIEQ